MRKHTAATVLAATVAAAALPACYGSYSAFHKVNKWNGTVSTNKWINSAVHLGLWIVPVYELALAGDFLVFNTVEHFTDKPVFE